MIIKMTLLILLFLQVVYLLVKAKNSKEKKYYIPALLVSLVTAWLIYKTFTMDGFGAINSLIFSVFGLLISFVFTKHLPFSKGEYT